jgi:hypothetical protein
MHLPFAVVFGIPTVRVFRVIDLAIRVVIDPVVALWSEGGPPPGGVPVRARTLRQVFLPATIDVHNVDLSVSISIALEDDLLAIR